MVEKVAMFSIVMIMISALGLIFIFSRKFQIEWLVVVVVLSLILVYFSIGLIFLLAGIMYDIFNQIYPTLTYSDSLTTVTATFGILGTVLSIFLSLSYKNKDKA